jgi:hypothetical protein
MNESVPSYRKGLHTKFIVLFILHLILDGVDRLNTKIKNL